MPTKFGTLKLGVAFELFRGMYKTLFLKYKSKLLIFPNPNEFLVQNNQIILENAHISEKVNGIGHNFQV